MMARFILASGSASRRAILSAANVPFESVSPDVDEEAAKAEALRRGVSARSVAQLLADAKALKVSRADAKALVLGADQVLVCDGRLFNKATSIEDARETLQTLRDRKHELISALALAQAGEIVWRHVDGAELWVRNFSDAFLDGYLAREGGEILGSVGCYRIEGMGALLFEKIAGDQFTIRGLSLLPLLGALRERGIIPA